MLIGAIDDRGPHLYVVNDVTVNSYKAMGYVAIGIGTNLATVSLTRGGKCYYTKSVPETMYRVYEAKRDSQETALVSKTTDMVIIRKSADPQPITQSQIDIMSRIYEDRVKRHALLGSEVDEIADSLQPPMPPPPEAPGPSTDDPQDPPPSPGSS